MGVRPVIHELGINKALLSVHMQASNLLQGVVAGNSKPSSACTGYLITTYSRVKTILMSWNWFLPTCRAPVRDLQATAMWSAPSLACGKVGASLPLLGPLTNVSSAVAKLTVRTWSRSCP